MNDFMLASCFSFSLFLAGCPQGDAKDTFRLDGGDDSGDVEASVATSNDAGESGARCGADGKDECGAGTVCDPNLGCVECRADDDCPIAAAHCLVGICVGCRPAKTDCPEGQACSTADFECRPRCVDALDCPSGTTCDDSSGECVGCLDDQSCAGKVCSQEKRQCVECASDESCPASKPRCRAVLGECVKCTASSDCGVAAPVCDPVTFTCRVDSVSGPTDAGAD